MALIKKNTKISKQLEVTDIASCYELKDGCKAIVYISVKNEASDLLEKIVVQLLEHDKMSVRNYVLYDITDKINDYYWNKEEQIVINDAIDNDKDIWRFVQERNGQILKYLGLVTIKYDD